MTFQLEMPDIEPAGPIPVKFTCDGDNVSPALRWSDVPDGTRSFALIVDDPDAPRRTWVHWLVYDVPAATRDLPEGVPPRETLPSGARQGSNDFGDIGYGGPCPPRGPAHRYYFRLYALDTTLKLEPGAHRAALERAMHGHILAITEAMGRYKRGTATLLP